MNCRYFKVRRKATRSSICAFVRVSSKSGIIKPAGKPSTIYASGFTIDWRKYSSAVKPGTLVSARVATLEAFRESTKQ